MNLGVVGGGQLGRMLSQAALPLGIKTKFLDPSDQSCAAATGRLICAPYDDADAIRQLSEHTDAVTFEFENVPPVTVEKLAESLPVYPSAQALATARDRWTEKYLFRQLNIETPAFEKIDDQQMLNLAINELRYPAVLKTRTLGYDGKGQKIIRSSGDVDGAFELLGGVPLIIESFIEFEYEVSCIGVRSKSRECVFYPLIKNEHHQSILYRSQPIKNSILQTQAESIVKKIMEALNYVGTLAFEFFVKDDLLIANEIAPRVHNSGHWTIEGSATSQFENHVRAVMGLPLGSTETRGEVVMYNLIGRMPAIQELLAVPGVHLHNYDKAERPGRKIGHITVTSENLMQLKARCEKIESLLVNNLGS
jgi:5-(carboxyamino)imidazole ribonucleotide synthase